MTFSVNSIMIPMLHDFAFTQLGINIKSKDGSAVQHYFDALKFGEDVCDKSEANIYFAIKDAERTYSKLRPSQSIPLRRAFPMTKNFNY